MNARLRIVTAFVVLAGCGRAGPSGQVLATGETTPSSAYITQLQREEAAKPKFDGVIQGIHFVPEEVLSANGPPSMAPCPTPARNLEPTVVTDLDFVVTRPPSLPYVIKKVTGPTKIACGTVATWVGYSYELSTPFGDGFVSVAHRRLSRFEIGRTASPERVSSSGINGRPAVVIKPLDTSGVGNAEIIIVEDSTLDPWGSVFLLSSEWVTLDELRATAEGIK
jgi:hypothetical protein